MGLLNMVEIMNDDLISERTYERRPAAQEEDKGKESEEEE